MVRKSTQLSCIFAASILLAFCGQMSAQQDTDPPSRVARLNYINGNVSMEPAGIDEWTAAELNRPFTTGDYLYADTGAEAELHLDVAVLRMGAQTSFGFLNLDDHTVQLKLTEGDLYIRVRNFGSDQVFEVDTPNAAVNLLQNGVYRFRVDPNGTMSFVVVREGQAQITGGGQTFLLNPGSSALLNGTDQLSYDVEDAPAPDEFDNWSQERDAHEERLSSSRYVSPGMVGYEDLDDYGTWQQTVDYGPVWYPQAVATGWAPYQYGRWTWIAPWGWTWVDSMPWGFAPFHYGRWAYTGNRWGWCPGPISPGYGRGIRPYYAPAMVAWFGGPNFGLAISASNPNFGLANSTGPRLGWVPLGYGEVYTPAYRCTSRYFNNVNTYNTRVMNNVNMTNVYNTVYVNHQTYNQQLVNVRAPNAVMAMPQSAFASGRPVRQAGAVVPQASLAKMQTAPVIAPPVAPTRQALLSATSTRVAARPSPQIAQRGVVARSTPPAPANFAAHQQYLQQHTGEPVNFGAMRQATGATPAVATNVHQVRAPAVAGATVARPGQRVGSPQVAIQTPLARPGLAGATPQPASQRQPPTPQLAQPARTPTQPVYSSNRGEQPAVVSGRAVTPPSSQQQVRPVTQPQEPAVHRNVAPPAQTQPAATSHGLPPNMRPNNQGAEPVRAGGQYQPPASGTYPRPQGNAGQTNQYERAPGNQQGQYRLAPPSASAPRVAEPAARVQPAPAAPRTENSMEAAPEPAQHPRTEERPERPAAPQAHPSEQHGVPPPPSGGAPRTENHSAPPPAAVSSAPHENPPSRPAPAPEPRNHR